MQVRKEACCALLDCNLICAVPLPVALMHGIELAQCDNCPLCCVRAAKCILPVIEGTVLYSRQIHCVFSRVKVSPFDQDRSPGVNT